MPADPPALPNFLIVGAMRSGTTTLANHLDEHPDVFVAPGKELHFFDRHYDRGVGWYAAQFAGARGERAVGEATPRYMYEEDAVGRMAATVPEASLLVLLRDPVDRAYSHYWHNRSRGQEPLEFAAAVAEESKRDVGGRTSGFGYVSRGRYLEQLERLCAAFSREQIFVTLFEDLRDHPEATFAAVCSALGVDQAFRPSTAGRSANAHVAFRSQRVRRLSRRLPAPLARPVGRLNTRRQPYPPLDPALRADLAATFATENAALAPWLGRDLHEWSRPR